MLAQQRMTPAVKFLVILFPIIFVAQLFISQLAKVPLLSIFAFIPNSFFSGALWQGFSYSFLHGSPVHVLLNCLMLYMIGPNLERIWGRNKFLKYFFVCALGGAMLHSLIWAVSSLFSPALAEQIGRTPVVGASGAIYGLMYGLMRFFGNAQVFLFFMFPMNIKVAMAIFLGLDLLNAFSSNDNTAHWVHIGGFITGYVYIKIKGNNLDGRGGGFLKKRPMDREELKRRLSVISNESFENKKDGKYPITWN